MQTIIHFISQNLWMVSLAWAVYYKFSSLRITRILAAEYGISIKKNIIGAFDDIELKALRNGVRSKEIKNLIENLLGNKAWTYAFSIITVILFVLLPLLKVDLL